MVVATTATSQFKKLFTTAAATRIRATPATTTPSKSETAVINQY